ncbi:snRNP Sm protein [Yamadazyma tenuis]|uniref:LSM2-LSM8 complex subunit LSM8 n=1 Tax=Candida tenuis (strain ATCC 10573 / BCRC 21748 / CBS 615 / JCM 9827 / NBRC 10315 / NRRL Y-1498 / VKM Y-70) TaxID=590646 RepID=G3BB92_CANTC|nr:uncharacterized protein CANTEDRAFT_124295 [Yamadazyma tenuis ATCC 10573]EGV61519.1 hypothetical protein CANTEDRAFT_124295 [Yamadazyma tenuis ATCC 10573]WEJ92742.1 snRNP Sm protein [Yamadazyma tenuis]
MSSWKEFLYKKVRVITTDARLFEGKLEGIDNATNIVISNCIERIARVKGTDDKYQQLDMGLYMLRGGTVVCIGEVDESIPVDWENLTGDKLKDTKNPL